MGLISGYAWIVPAVTAVGWVLSWWGPRRIRWGLLSASAVVSVFCVLVGVLGMGPPVSPEDVGCSSPMACMDWSPIYWVVAGLIGFVCCGALAVVTVVVEIVVRTGRGASA